jgi:antitoxin HigA-1
MPPVTPGEILRDEFMKPYGLSANALAKALRVPSSRISAILNGTRAITADTARRLARYFNTSPQSWLNLQKNCELETARRTVGQRIAKEVEPRAA